MKNKIPACYCKIAFIIVLLFALTHNLSAQEIVRVTDFGVEKNSFKNAAHGIQLAINACKNKPNSILQLPGGRIDIWPDESFSRELYISNCTESDTFSKEKKVAFFFENCNNITVDGNNTLVVLHGKMISFALLRSSNIKIKNIGFDYDRPTMSEMTVNSVSNKFVEVSVHPDSKYYIDSGRVVFYGDGWKTQSHHTILFDTADNTMHYSSFEPLLKSKAIEVSPLHLRFEGNFDNLSFKPGNILTVRDPYRDNCGAFISLSKNVEVENVNMHYMHGMGIVSQFSENISLSKVTIKPRANSGRVVAAFADCFHFSGCKEKVSVDSCYTSGSHDDAVNIHGTHLQITEVDANRMKVKFMHHQTYGFEAFFAGDSVAFVNPKTLLHEGFAKVKKATMINKREMELEFDGKSSTTTQAGYCVENLTWYPEVVISNCRFERTNTRGILVTTRKKAVIENNYFYKTGMFPILVADDAASWYESGAVQDIIIRNNVFDECGYNSGGGPIDISPENKEFVPGKYVHKNFTITGNLFKVKNGSVLNARSVDNLNFSNNKIEYTDKLENNPVISLNACRNVYLKKNAFNFRDRPRIEIANMENVKFEN